MLFGTDYKGSQFRMEEQTEQGKMLLCDELANNLYWN
jgi:hypothetical protein